MKTTQLELFLTSELNKYYYLMLRPGQPIFTIAQGMKKLADDIIGIDINRLFRSHISLFKFPMPERKERLLINTLESQLSKLILPLSLKSDGLKIFSKQHIVISIITSEDFQQLVRELIKMLFQAGLIRAKKIDYSNIIPHITITKTTGSKNIEEVMKMLMPNFTDSEFYCSDLVLLKSTTGQAPWTPVISFSLAN